jgi:hypothetical protein
VNTPFYRHVFLLCVLRFYSRLWIIPFAHEVWSLREGNLHKVILFVMFLELDYMACSFQEFIIWDANSVYFSESWYNLGVPVSECRAPESPEIKMLRKRRSLQHLAGTRLYKFKHKFSKRFLKISRNMESSTHIFLQPKLFRKFYVFFVSCLKNVRYLRRVNN